MSGNEPSHSLHESAWPILIVGCDGLRSAGRLVSDAKRLDVERAKAGSRVGAALEPHACLLLMLAKQWGEEHRTRNACAGARKRRVQYPLHEVAPGRKEYRR